MEVMNNPLAQLRALEEQGRDHVVDLVSRASHRELWRAVSFRVDNTLLLLDEHDVAELLTLPEITSVPHTKRWLVGVANIRSELLPIVNFGDFLFNQPIRPGRQVRLLVVQYEDIRSGLIVDEVYGVRRFITSNLGPALTAELNDVLKLIVTGHYEDEQHFHIVDIKKLIQESEFMHATA